MSEYHKPDVTDIKTETAAHTVLNTIITQASINKKSYRTKLLLSYAEAMKGIGEDDTYTEPDMELLIEISCRWIEAGSLEEEQIVIEEDEEGGASDE